MSSLGGTTGTDGSPLDPRSEAVVAYGFGTARSGEGATIPIPLSDLLAYRVEEAAALVGLSVGAFRRYLLPRCPKIRLGRSVRIPRDPFRQFLGSLEDHDEQIRESAREIVARMRR